MPKIHTSSSSTKIPTPFHLSHPAHTAKPGTYTAHTGPQTTSTIPSSTRIHHPLLSNNTNTYHLSYCHKKTYPYFFES